MKNKTIDMKQIDLDNAKKEMLAQSRSDIMYVDQNIAIIRSVSEISKTEAFLVNGFITVTVTSGHAAIKIDNQEYQITTGDTFVCTPRNIIDNAMISVGFDMLGMIVSPKFGQQLTRETGMDIPAFTISSSHMIAHLSDREMESIMKYYDMLMYVCQKESSIMRDRAMYHLLQAAAIELFDVFSKREHEPVSLNNYSAAEQTFVRFIEMLHNEKTPLHTVNEYADRLHITPKYFSAICKQVAGRTASDIINEEIVNTARILLRDPRNSIKQVADKLNFTNQSHFGTFMRRHTGMSPQQLRETL